MSKVEKLAKEIREMAKHIDYSEKVDGVIWIEADKIIEVCNKYVPIEKPFPKLMKSNGECFIILVHKCKLKYTVIEGGELYNYKTGDVDTIDIHGFLSEFHDFEIEVKNENSPIIK